MPECEHPLRHREEPTRHHKVREIIPDDVDLDPAGRRPAQRVLEGLTHLVELPDVGLEVHHLPGTVDGGEHVTVEFLAEGIDGDLVLADGNRFGGGVGEAP